MLALCIVGAVLTAGCGVKAPPVPPQRSRPEAVTDLSYKLADGRVTLSWTVPPAGKRKGSEIAGCTVYRSKRAPEGSECIDCSAAFEPAAEVAAGKDTSDQAGPQRLGYSEDLSPGAEYAYQVICRTAAGTDRQESNIVSFAAPQTTTQQP